MCCATRNIKPKIKEPPAALSSIVIPGTLQDSPYLLDGLLEHQTELQPKELITDSAGYSDIVFGLFWLLGFQVSQPANRKGSQLA
jgi:TnpA family transposase